MSEVDVARLVYKAKLAEQAERFEEMCQFMKEVIRQKENLDREEQQLFGLAYKNNVAGLRTAWRVVDTARMKYEGKNPEKAGFCSSYAESLGSQIRSICSEVRSCLSTLAPSAQDPVSRVFYAKMMADYKRYEAELDRGETKSAGDAYRQAIDMARNQLRGNDPLRMGLGLNYSVFRYELEDNVDGACQVAQETIDACNTEGGVEPSREAALVEQLLRDNLDVWRSEKPQPEEGLER